MGRAAQAVYNPRIPLHDRDIGLDREIPQETESHARMHDLPHKSSEGSRIENGSFANDLQSPGNDAGSLVDILVLKLPDQPLIVRPGKGAASRPSLDQAFGEQDRIQGDDAECSGARPGQNRGDHRLACGVGEGPPLDQTLHQHAFLGDSGSGSGYHQGNHFPSLPGRFGDVNSLQAAAESGKGSPLSRPGSVSRSARPHLATTPLKPPETRAAKFPRTVGRVRPPGKAR
jgi:hypothetical protein